MMTALTHHPRQFGALLVGLLATTALTWSGSASAATSTATVSVNAGQSLATFPATGVGANVALWDGLLADSSTSTLLKNAGVSMIRYPGGSYGDIYHWQTHTTDGGYVAANTTFDQYMTMVRAAGAQPIVIANYGSGTPQEAADWVRYENVTKGYGVKYWEIGNEVYGNGHYGSAWETDNHADKSPRAYANNFLLYASAMKAVDPTIKVGVVLTTPGYWPDGVVGSGDSSDWNDTVMSIVKNSADYGIFHWYPGGSSEADTLAKAGAIKSAVTTFKADMTKYATNNPGVFITETNTGASPADTQAPALWAADTYLSAAEAGADNLDWWDVRNGPGSTSTDVTGATDYGDGGIISSGTGAEPPAGTPFAPYYGIQMVSRVAGPGDTLVSATSSSSLLAVHAARRSNGNLDVLLINKDPANSYTVSLSYAGYTPASTTTVDTFANRASAITTSTSGSATSQTIAPYTLMTVHLHPVTTTTTTTRPTTTTTTTTTTTRPTTTTTRPTTTTTTASTTTTTTRPVTTTTTTTTTASTTTTTTRPVTTTSTTTSAAGGCTAVYRTVGSWPQGFQGEVSVQAGSAAVSNWTVTWDLASGQGLSQVWNGTGSVSGSTVTVHNAAWNGSLTPGASTTFGLIGTGSASAPTLRCTAS